MYVSYFLYILFWDGGIIEILRKDDSKEVKNILNKREKASIWNNYFTYVTGKSIILDTLFWYKLWHLQAVLRLPLCMSYYKQARRETGQEGRQSWRKTTRFKVLSWIYNSVNVWHLYTFHKKVTMSIRIFPSGLKLFKN